MSDKAKKQSNANNKPRIVSLRDLNSHEENSSDEDEKQVFYAGGEKSGTAIRGPNRGESQLNNNARNIINDIFSQAASEDAFKPSKYAGSGRSLSGSTSQNEADSTVAVVNLIFWQDGFTVGDGPLRQYEDPESVQFLQSLRSGSISPSQLGLKMGGLIDVKITQLPALPYTKQKHSKVLTESTTESGTEEKEPMKFAGHGEKIGEVDTECVAIDLNLSIPESVINTRIQIVLPGGQKKVITIDARAKISALYSTISKETGLNGFVIKLGTPPKTLPEHLDALVFQAGLLNSSVILVPIAK